MLTGICLFTLNTTWKHIMYHRTFIMFMFGSIFDHKFNISDIDNSIVVDTFMYVYDHNSQ